MKRSYSSFLETVESLRACVLTNPAVFLVVLLVLLPVAIAGCSTRFHGKRIYEVSFRSWMLVASGDTSAAEQYLQTHLPLSWKPQTRVDSANAARIYLRALFLASRDSSRLSATWYRAGYPFFPALPETLRVDALRWSGWAAAVAGDSTEALLLYSEARHRALLHSMIRRTVEIDACLLSLRPRELQQSRQRLQVSGLVLVGIFALSCLCVSMLTLNLYHRRLQAILRSSTK